MNVSNPNGFGGGGKIWGTLGYDSAKQFHYDGYEQDNCPGDGYGVSYVFAMRAVQGVPSDDLTGVIDWDTDGCGNGFNNRSGTISRTWKIKSAEVTMCASNNGTLCWVEFGWSTWKDNPYT